MIDGGVGRYGVVGLRGLESRCSSGVLEEVDCLVVADLGYPSREVAVRIAFYSRLDARTGSWI